MTEKELRKRIEWCDYAYEHYRFPDEAAGWAKGSVARETVYQILADLQSELIDLLDARLRQSDEEKRKQMLASVERTIAGLSSSEPDDHS